MQLAGRQGCFNVYSAHTHNPVGFGGGGKRADIVSTADSSPARFQSRACGLAAH